MARPLPESDVMVIVMAFGGSGEGRQRAQAAMRTWRRQWPPGRVLGCAEQTNAGLGLVTLPEIFNKSTYGDAQRRQAACLKHLAKLEGLPAADGSGGGGGGASSSSGSNAALPPDDPFAAAAAPALRGLGNIKW